VPDRAFDGAALLVSVERGGINKVSEALVKTGASIRGTALVGSHATRYTVPLIFDLPLKGGGTGVLGRRSWLKRRCEASATKRSEPGGGPSRTDPHPVALRRPPSPFQGEEIVRRLGATK
jgi:hypothetical protein